MIFIFFLILLFVEASYFAVEAGDYGWKRIISNVVFILIWAGSLIGAAFLTLAIKALKDDRFVDARTLIIDAANESENRIKERG